MTEYRSAEPEQAEGWAPPVFILSPARRSGTNFLYNLLLRTELFAQPTPALTAEDFLLAKSDLLFDYMDALAGEWEQQTGESKDTRRVKSEITRRIGEVLISTIRTETARPTLLKTPWIFNLARAFDLFPDCRIILLVRDGRDTCESTVRSGYARDHLHSFATWAAHVRVMQKAISTFEEQGRSGSVHLIRYEDVVEDPQGSLRRIFDFLGLVVPEGFVPDIESLPVYGSSVEGRAPDEAFRWRKIERPAGFNPVGRWKSWDSETLRAFDVICGAEMLRLGYDSGTK